MKNDNEYLHSLYSFFVLDVFLDAVKQIFLWYNVYVKIRHLDKRHRQSEHRLQEICKNMHLCIAVVFHLNPN